MMKFNQWTLGLAAVGLVSLTSAARADEKPSPVLSALSSTTLSGFVDTSAQWNLGKGNANAPGYGFGGPAKADGFNLNVVDLNLEKDAEASDGWGSGYKVELWMGPDANTLGTQSSIGTSGGGKADFAIKNAYVDLKASVGNGLDIKIGVWDTFTGYETPDSINNPNFTRSYSWTIEQTTDTGILLGYTVNDMISLQGGVADTYGPVINSRSLSSTGNVNESYKTYLGGVTLTAPKDWGWASGSTLSATIINGFNLGGGPTSPGGPSPGGPGLIGRNQTSIYVGGTMNTPLKELKVGACYDYVGVDGQPLTAVGFPLAEQTVYQNNVALYATYQLTEKLSLNARGEYFTQSKDISGLGLPSKVIEGTLTAQYDLWKNVMTRAEFRWDHQAGALSATASGPAYGGPGGTLANSYELIANVAYKF